jgi:fatty acid desaturase
MAPLQSLDLKEQAPRSPRIVSWEELESHRDNHSWWICIDNKAYDVTEWSKSHPGGPHALKNMAGRDASDLVKQLHKEISWKGRVTNMYVGEMEPRVTASGGNKEFAEECRQLRIFLELSGWFKTTFWFNFLTSLRVYAMFVVSWILVIKGADMESRWMQYIGALILGLFWQQCNFLGHDAGHGSLIPNKFWNEWYGLILGNISSGVGLAWWNYSHYTHHVVTNVITHDPDIQHLPVLAVSEKFYNSIYSSYLGRVLPFDRLSKFMVGYQHILFYPIMSVARLFLQFNTLLHILIHPHCPNRLREFVGFCLFVCWWTYMLSYLPTWGSLAIFYYLTHFAVAIIHIQITMSHFMMETFDRVPYEQTDESFYEFQLRTSLDIDCPTYLDWFHGGLQFQVVHHLFPRIPRSRLRELSYIVEAICKKHGIKYHKYGFLEANYLTWKNMARVAKGARQGKLVKFEETLVFQGMNMIG